MHARQEADDPDPRFKSTGYSATVQLKLPSRPGHESRVSFGADMSRPSHFAGPTTGTLRLENRHTREVLIMRRVRHGNQVVLELERSAPPKADGPPLHIHVIEREEGEVIAGVLSAVVGGETIKVRAGESVAFPAGVPHRWCNAEDQSLQMKGRVVPVADLDRFLPGVFT